MSKAVVATTLGAEGFIRADQAMILADKPDEFASACIRLAKNTTERQEWGIRASEFAASYDWKALIPPLFTVLES
jgi:hypothetical protein